MRDADACFWLLAVMSLITDVFYAADKTITVWKLATSGSKRGAGKDLLPDGPAIKQVLMVSVVSVVSMRACLTDGIECLRRRTRVTSIV